MKSGDTPVYRLGSTPVTQTALSTRIKVFSYSARQSGNLYQIGMISSMGPSQSRAAEARRGIGFGDKIAELVPGNMDAVTLSVDRFCLYVANMMQVFGYNYGFDGIVRTLAHHRWPFDIRQELVIPSYIATGVANYGGVGNSTDSDDTKAIVTFYEGCWMTDYSVTYAVDDTSISESCTVSVTDVFQPGVQYQENINSGNYANGVPFSTRLSGANDALFQVGGDIGTTAT